MLIFLGTNIYLNMNTRNNVAQILHQIPNSFSINISIRNLKNGVANRLFGIDKISLMI